MEWRRKTSSRRHSQEFIACLGNRAGQMVIDNVYCEPRCLLSRTHPISYANWSERMRFDDLLTTTLYWCRTGHARHGCPISFPLIDVCRNQTAQLLGKHVQEGCGREPEDG